MLTVHLHSLRREVNADYFEHVWTETNA